MPFLAFKLNEHLYLRDPQSSELGQRIITASIDLIDKLGFEQFTFKKLAEEIDSTEASVYRYFENKHRLLLYLIDWYWTWLKYQLDIRITNISSPGERLRVCLAMLAEPKSFDSSFAHIDETALHKIAMSEFEKTYLTKQVDQDNKDGFFLPYKVLCKKIAAIIKEVNPRYPYPATLVSTIMLAVNHQLFYAEHLPSLTDIKFNTRTHYKRLAEFLEDLTFKAIKS